MRISPILENEIRLLKNKIENKIKTTISFSQATEIYAKANSSINNEINITIKKNKLEIKRI